MEPKFLDHVSIVSKISSGMFVTGVFVFSLTWIPDLLDYVGLVFARTASGLSIFIGRLPVSWLDVKVCSGILVFFGLFYVLGVYQDWIQYRWNKRALQNSVERVAFNEMERALRAMHDCHTKEKPNNGRNEAIALIKLFVLYAQLSGMDTWEAREDLNMRFRSLYEPGMAPKVSFVYDPRQDFPTQATIEWKFDGHSYTVSHVF